MRSYLTIWLLTTLWCVVIACAGTLIVGLCIIMPAVAWPVIGFVAAGLGFTAYVASILWIGKERNRS